MYRSGALASLSFALLAAALPLAAQPTTQAPSLQFSNTLRFAYQRGTSTPAPPAQTVRIYSAPANVPYTASVEQGAGWLTINNQAGPVSGTTFGTTSTGVPDLTIGVSPLQTDGEYTGRIRVRSGTTDAFIDVTYRVGTLATLRPEPGSFVNVPVEAGRLNRLVLQVTPTTAGTQMQYQAEILTGEPLAWFPPVTPAIGSTGGATPQQHEIFVAVPAGTTTGFATATVRLTPFNGGAPVTVPLSVQVVPGAQLVLSSQSVTFPYQFGYPLGQRSVTISSDTQSPLFWTATVTGPSSSWLNISTNPAATGSSSTATGNTPATLYLIPNTTSITAAGQYEALVRVEAPATNSVQTLTVRLVASANALTAVQPDSLSFTYNVGSTPPAAQQLLVTNTSGSAQFQASAVYGTGGNWFTVSPANGSTGSNVTVSLVPTALPGVGTYTGTVRITSNNNNIDVPVRLTVANTNVLSSDVQSLTFESSLGGTLPARVVTIRSVSGEQAFTAAIEFPQGTPQWLSLVQPPSTTTPAGTQLTLIPVPNVITSAGTYGATLRITPVGATNAQPLVIPITYVVAATAQVSADVTRLELTQAGTTPPANRTIKLSSTTPGATFSWAASSTVAWLKPQASGTVPGDLVVQFDTASLTPGDYSGNILISITELQSVLTIPVTLKVGTPVTLQLSQAGPLSFAFAQGGAAPAAQTIGLTSTGAAIAFTATSTTTTGGNWLRVEPASGTTAAAGGAPANLRISAEPTGLTPGTYNGTVTIAAPGASNASTTVNVTLTVSSQAAPTGITLSNAATGLSRGVSPGLLITIKGRNMAPSTAATTQVTNNRISTTLGDVRVTFDGVEAPLLYVGPSGDRIGDQINAIVPYSISGRATTRMIVEYRSVRSEPLELVVRETDPGIFTTTQTGSGSGAILNQDNSVNGTNAPAARGTVVQIYATGEGLSVPAQATGAVITGTSLPQPLLPVSARVNGQPASVLYQGGAPGLAAGVLQVNVRIPENLALTAPTSVPIEIVVGSQASQPGVTVAVRP